MKFRNDARRLVMYTYIFGPRTATNYNVYNVHITYRITLPLVYAVKEAMTTFVTERLPKPLFSFRLYTVAGRSLCSSDHGIISSNNNGKIWTGLCVSNFTMTCGAIQSCRVSTLRYRFNGFFFNTRYHHGSKNAMTAPLSRKRLQQSAVAYAGREKYYTRIFSIHIHVYRDTIEHSNRFADSGCCLY